MDSNNDVDFDAYWAEESRNKNRNRIRVGRQYQASVPPLLKPGESDDRQLEDLETQYWKPSLNDEAIHEYLSMAKAVSVFNCSLESQSHDNLQSAIRGLTEFVMSHHPCHRDAGCRMSVKSNWTNKEAELLACALERCENANRRKMAEECEESGSDEAEGMDETSDIEADCQNSSTSGVELPVDVNPPSEIKPVPARVIGRKTESPVPDASPTTEGSGTAGGAAASENSRVESANTSQQLPESLAAGQGSLKFYLKGQLILKLNAHQERKTWVEDPDNPAGSGQFGGSPGGLSGGGQNRRKAGRKTHRASTTSSGIAWPERGSPSQESTSSMDSHNSTSTSTTTTTCAPPSLPTSSAPATSTACGTNHSGAGGGGGGGSSSSSSSSSSSTTSSSANASSGATQQPAPLDLSSQQS